MSAAARNSILVIVACLLFSVAGYLVFGRSRNQLGIPTISSIDTVCLACKHETQVEARLSDFPPHACRQCGASAVMPWRYCFGCNKRFVQSLVRDPIDNTWRPALGPPVCALCGKSETGAFNPRDPRQTGTGAASLPKWPPE